MESKRSSNCADALEVRSGGGRENYYVILCLQVSIFHALRLAEGKQEQHCRQKELDAKHLTAKRKGAGGEREESRGENYKSDGGLEETGRRREEGREEVVGWGPGRGAGSLGARGRGGRESVNSLDIRCPDLASGGREDGLATKDRLRKHGGEGELWGDGGLERKKGARRISMA